MGRRGLQAIAAITPWDYDAFVHRRRETEGQSIGLTGNLLASSRISQDGHACRAPAVRRCRIAPASDTGFTEAAAVTGREHGLPFATIRPLPLQLFISPHGKSKIT